MASAATPKTTLGELYLRKRHPQNRLLEASSFERYCRERDMNLDKSRLEALERDGVLRPLLRIQRPRIPYKKMKKTEAGVEQEVLVPLAEDAAVATE